MTIDLDEMARPFREEAERINRLMDNGDPGVIFVLAEWDSEGHHRNIAVTKRLDAAQDALEVEPTETVSWRKLTGTFGEREWQFTTSYDVTYTITPMKLLP